MVEVGIYRVVATAAGIATKPLLASAPPGLYAVAVYVVASASVGGALTVTLAWKDSVAAQTATPITGAIAANGKTQTFYVMAHAGGNTSITVATTITAGTMTYDFTAALFRLKNF
jgi:hypothetical protein